MVDGVNGLVLATAQQTVVRRVLKVAPVCVIHHPKKVMEKIVKVNLQKNNPATRYWYAT